jgi:L-lactate dehydrogenase complex protein LldG
MGDAMFETFKKRAEEVSSEVHRFCTKAETLSFILDLLVQEGVADSPQSLALWADCSFLRGTDRKRLAERVPGLKFEVTRERAANAKIGISKADWAVANTGTLVQDATDVTGRLVSTLPLIHISLLTTRNILADLPGLFSRISPDRAGYISFITGPSRTADIERVLTIGVHGPERLIIICVDEEDADGTD